MRKLGLSSTRPIMRRAKRHNSVGFTIIELIIVIVVIGILASITIVSFVAIRDSATKRDVNAEAGSLGADLKKLRADSGSYPQDLSDVNTSSQYTYGYSTSSGGAFCASATKGSYSAYVTNLSSEPKEGNCATTCLDGYIKVPGDSRFGTSDFCVMKYEAKIAGKNDGNQPYSAGLIPDSRAAGTPWVNITQTDAIAEAQTACTGCHLITEPEWMTIAANVLSVASNWSGGAVGSGYIYQGHVNYSPGSPMAASANDADGLYGFTATGGLGLNNRRTLTLTNGEVIWDLSGNVHDWVDGTIAANQQPGLVGESAFAFKQWNNGSLAFRGLAVSSRPSAISGTVAGYSSTQGIGQLYSNYGDTQLRGMSRGGSWGGGVYAGVLMVNVGWSPSLVDSSTGFRVAR